eukprot:s164_g51.t1
MVTYGGMRQHNKLAPPALSGPRWARGGPPSGPASVPIFGLVRAMAVLKEFLWVLAIAACVQASTGKGCGAQSCGAEGNCEDRACKVVDINNAGKIKENELTWLKWLNQHAPTRTFPLSHETSRPGQYHLLPRLKVKPFR